MLRPRRCGYTLLTTALEGSIKTELQRHASAFEKFVIVSSHGLKILRTSLTDLQSYILYPAPYGALTQLWAGVMPETLQLNGEVRISCVLCCR